MSQKKAPGSSGKPQSVLFSLKLQSLRTLGGPDKTDKTSRKYWVIKAAFLAWTVEGVFFLQNGTIKKYAVWASGGKSAYIYCDLSHKTMSHHSVRQHWLETSKLTVVFIMTPNTYGCTSFSLPSATWNKWCTRSLKILLAF